ncbi:hypothetical protein M7I_0330 [Glarea lozoyensis 74030]|uniref:Uncharacterized protein n=1 Tax=Glarea lozoyensis (strain ATCC 74030 / MF5533) TaxID=1104152 RepID=H0ED30_GLAL7|nr:hypothetical protein M7I_0330 [Glarea lozoyensis 74030]
MSITGLPEKTATRHLKIANWKIDQASDRMVGKFMLKILPKPLYRRGVMDWASSESGLLGRTYWNSSRVSSFEVWGKL